MKYKTIQLCAIFLLGIGISGLRAQEAITSSGGEANGSGGSASYTVGQVAYTTNFGSAGSVEQGIQHGYEIKDVSNIATTKSKTIQLSVYPNPVTNNLSLKVDDSQASGLSYQLYTLDGKLLRSGKISENKGSIDVHALLPATYFLSISQNDKKVKTFKIIKK